MKSVFICTLLFTSVVMAEITHLERGILLYGKRAENAKGLKANTQLIDQSITELLKAYKIPEDKLDAGIYLLRCYYYKGKFISDSDEKKKVMFNKGKSLGEKMIALYPASAAVYYWYLVNLGSWSEIYGILAAAKEGVANTMQEYAKNIIDIDSTYSDGGGYFMLGAVHLKSPYIPFILSWPSDEKALKYLLLAYNTGDATPSQTVYLARAFYTNDQKEKAISLLTSLLGQDISESYKLEDIDQHKIAKEQLNDWK